MKASFCTPPESVKTSLAFFSSRSISKYETGSIMNRFVEFIESIEFVGFVGFDKAFSSFRVRGWSGTMTGKPLCAISFRA